MNKVDVVKEVFLKEGYLSSDEFIGKFALVVALSKVEQYRAENDFFESKYRMKLDEFDSVLHKEKGREDFEKEEDVEDWEFALSAMRRWEERLKELQSASCF